MQLADYANRYETLRFERNDGVLEMHMHSGGGEVQWNVSLTGHHNELGLAFADVAKDKENKVVILTGTGKNFVAARDENEVIPEADLHDMWDRMMDESRAMLEGLLSIPVPVIAAVNGPALIHSELPVMCDVVLAADHAEFADTTHMPWGMPPGDGTQMIWPMVLGPNRGRYFLLSGETLSAAEAHRLGVVGEVLPADQLMPRAREFAARLAAFPRRNLSHAKTLMVRSLRHRIRDEMELGLFAQGMAIV
ncbi:MAG: enoyl-CoA hydratase/isomerase family protein [Novosphingobium sp.]|nr:enoyl-CoA hydratase/isomerase family protein [Novosphingobium sp.]